MKIITENKLKQPQNQYLSHRLRDLQGRVVSATQEINTYTKYLCKLEKITPDQIRDFARKPGEKKPSSEFMLLMISEISQAKANFKKEISEIKEMLSDI